MHALAQLLAGTGEYLPEHLVGELQRVDRGLMELQCHRMAEPPERHLAAGRTHRVEDGLDDGQVQRRLERAGDLEGHGHATGGQREHQDLLAPGEVPEDAGQRLSGLGPVAEGGIHLRTP